MKNVSGSQVVTSAEVSELQLPAEIQEALGELVGAARDGLLASSVGVGLRVVHELMEAEVTEIVGPKGKHDPDRTASRHGHEDGSTVIATPHSIARPAPAASTSARESRPTNESPGLRGQRGARGLRADRDV
jgi:putative transposase